MNKDRQGDIMKKTEIEKIPFLLPKEVEKLTREAPVFDSSSSPEARVYFVKSDGGGLYLKRAERGSLKREAEMGAYFYALGLGPEVIEYVADGEYDLLLTRAAVGDDCTAEKYLESPKRLCDKMGEVLRALHELDLKGCPAQNRLNEYLDTAEENYRLDRFDKSNFPDSFGYRTGKEAYTVMERDKHLLKPDALIHGDFCLPNIMLDDWRFSAFIDLGGAGVADRHIDLFWGAWTLQFNLGTDKYRDRFFDAYGRDKIEEEKIKVIAAIEVFG